MVLNNIEELLVKYENGETTLNEEQQLKDYFSQETVEPHLEMYKPMFAYFLVNQQEQFTKDVTLKTRKIEIYKWISVAAVAVLMIGFYFRSPFVNSQEDLGTYEDPQLAYNEVVKSLGMVSKSFNKGKASVSYLGEMQKAGTQLEYLDEISNPLGRIFKN